MDGLFVFLSLLPMRTYLTAGAFCFAWGNAVAVYRVIAAYRQEEMPTVVTAARNVTCRHSFVQIGISDHLWEGRYSPRWPDGKIHSRNVYAATNEECEEKLADLIQQMRADIAEAKRLAAEGKWEEVMALAGQKKARGTRNIETNYQEKSITL